MDSIKIVTSFVYYVNLYITNKKIRNSIDTSVKTFPDIHLNRFLTRDQTELVKYLSCANNNTQYFNGILYKNNTTIFVLWPDFKIRVNRGLYLETLKDIFHTSPQNTGHFVCFFCFLNMSDKVYTLADYVTHVFNFDHEFYICLHPSINANRNIVFNLYNVGTHVLLQYPHINGPQKAAFETTCNAMVENTEKLTKLMENMTIDSSTYALLPTLDRIYNAGLKELHTAVNIPDTENEKEHFTISELVNKINND